MLRASSNGLWSAALCQALRSLQSALLASPVASSPRSAAAQPAHPSTGTSSQPCRTVRMQAVPRGAQQADDHDTVRHGVPEQQRQQPRAPGRRLGRHAQQQLDADLGWRQQWRQQQQVGQQRWQQQQQQQQQLEGGDHEPQRQRGRDSSRPGRPPAGGGRPQASSGAHTRSQLQVDPIGLTDAITAAQSVAGLQELWRQHKDHMQQIHLSAAFKAVVRVSVGLSARQQGTDGAARAAAAASASGSSTPGALQLLGHLSGRLLEDIHVARPWDLAQAAWACSKLNYRDTQLLDAIAQQVQRKAAVLLPQDIGQLASAYARLDYRHAALLALLQQQAIAKIADFAPWAAVHTAWALDRCGEDAAPLLQAAVQRLLAPGALQGLRPLDMSTLLSLLAGHRLRDQQLSQEAAAQLAADISTYPAAAASQSLLSCAALGLSTPALKAASGAAVLQLMQQQRGSPQQLAMAVFALAKLHACTDDVMAAAAAAFMQQRHAYPPNALCMLLWTCVLSAQQVQPGVWDALLQSSHRQLHAFTANQLASVVRGVTARPGWHEHALSSELVVEAAGLLQQQLRDISTPVLTKLLMGLASRSIREGSAPAAAADVNERPAAALLALLGSVVAEWQQQARLRQTPAASAVVAALTACGQHGLAAAAQQAVDAHATAHGADHTAQPAQPSAGSAASPDVPARGSWVDSFVAGAE